MEEFARLIQQGADVVGIEAARLWPSIVMVHWIVALVDLVFVPVIVGVVSLCGLKMARAAVSDKASRADTEMIWGGSAIFIGIFALLLSVAYAFSFSTMISTLFYPEASYVVKLIDK